MFIKISSININNNPDKSLVQAQKIENHCDGRLKFGHLFVLVEINKPSGHSNTIAKTIIDSLNNAYYQNDRMILSEQLTSLKIESFFEAALVKTSKTLLEHIDREKINIDFRDLNVTAGLIYEGEIYLSNRGKNKSFLIRKIKESYEISDINPEDDIENNDQENKIFSSIISGDIPNNSYIIISNPSLSEYLLNKEFIEIMDKLNLEGAKEQIKNSLAKINTYSNFSGLIIKNCLLEEKMKNNCILETKKDFRPENNHLYQSESQTEKLLNNTGSIDKKRVGTSIKRMLSKINIFAIPAKIYLKIKNNQINNKNKKEPQLAIQLETKKDTGEKKKRKIFIPLIAILIVFLAVNIYLKNNKEKKVEQQENISNIEESLNQKQKQIESFLLYNEDQALEAINSLRDEISGLSDKEREKVANLPEIEQKLQTYLDQIRKMNRIDNPVELANLSVLNNQAVPYSLSISGKNIYVSDAQNGKIYTINQDDGLSSVLAESDLLKSEKILSNRDSNGDAIFVNDKQFIRVDKNKKITYTKINTENFSNLSSFGFYNNRVYLLDTEKKQIFRYNLEGGEYKSPTAWIKDITPENPVSIEIDYNIYLLEKSGKINRYLSGNKEQFETKEIDPKIDSPKTIRLDKKYIYISETSEKRVIIFDRNNGFFVKQYYSPVFDNIKDFAVEDGIVYILNGTTIYKINLDI